jgi:hypothetical protein
MLQTVVDNIKFLAENKINIVSEQPAGMIKSTRLKDN